MLGIFALIALINLITFAGFWYDKSQARRLGHRIPERRLLLGATLGGWFGAKLGQQIFRHKTRKQPFARLLNFVPVVWAVIALIAFFST